VVGVRKVLGVCDQFALSQRRVRTRAVQKLAIHDLKCVYK
jgi:hypothetical protein